MSRQKPRRNKKYRPRDLGTAPLISHMHVIYAVFSPVYRVIDQMERDGTIDVAGDGMAVYKAAKDGKWYSFADGLLGLVETYEIWERRSGRNLNMLPIRQIIARIKYDTAITEIETRAARSAVDRMRYATMRMTAYEAEEMLRDFQIKEELLKVAA